jgi:hypothetical protein
MKGGMYIVHLGLNGKSLGKKSKVPTVVSRFLALHAATQKKKN